MLKISLYLFCWWLAVLYQLVCNIVRDDFVVLFYHRRVAKQLLDCGPGFLAAVCHVGVLDEVLPGASSFLKKFCNKILSFLDGISREGVFLIQLDVVLVPGGSVTSKARDIQCSTATCDRLTGDATKVDDNVHVACWGYW